MIAVRSIFLGLLIAVLPTIVNADDGPKITIKISAATVKPIDPNSTALARCGLVAQLANNSNSEIGEIIIQVREHLRELKNVEPHSVQHLGLLAGFFGECADVLVQLHPIVKVCRWRADTDADCRDFVVFTRADGTVIQ
ncbi:MAG TPA: hypothetical protein VF007_12875 [Stellaceae bacterium]